MTEGKSVDDAFDKFLELYPKGDIPSLVHWLLPNADSSYDELLSTNPQFPFFVNYLDACLFSNFATIRSYGFILKRLIAEHPATYSLKLISLLEDELDVVQAKSHSRLLRNKDWSEPFESHLQKIKAFKKFNPYFDALIPEDKNPLYRASRELILPTEKLAMDEPTLWIFNDLNHLLQALQFDDVLECLSNPKSALYLLDHYPHPQITNLNSDALKSLPKKFLSPNSLLKTSIQPLSAAIDAVCNQSKEAFESDSEPADWLYRLSNNALFAISQQRLGRARTAALIEKTNADRWYDPHKGLPLLSRPALPQYPDYFKDTLNTLEKSRPTFKKRLRLTHVTSQLVDQKHAPSRLLETLIAHRDPERFTVNVIITERLAYHPTEYPQPERFAKDSKEWGKQRIQTIERMGVPVKILSPIQSYESTAKEIAAQLSKEDIDIAVFHGPDVIHCMATTLAPCPLRVMFEHGTPLKYPGFELMIASSTDAPGLYGEQFAKFSTKIEALPFNLDVTKTWPKEPPKAQELGLPDDALIMTTVSNHLSARLGNQMLTAIAEILKSVPKAFYAPMGPVHEEKKNLFLQFFKDQGVSNRVLFLGVQPNPGHIARCMKLYLNEFPFGSCIGMLEAMASGCVPISMYDPNGPSQARYGGDFMGHDHVVTSGKVEDYIDLACQLLTNPQKYSQWSDYTKQQYCHFADEKAYVRNFELTLINNFNYNN